MASPRHMKGRGSVLTLFKSGVKVEPLDVEKWTTKVVKNSIADRVCGEDRDRLDSLVQHYTLSLSCYNRTTFKLVKLLEYDASSDNNSIEDVVSGLKLTDREGGGGTLFALDECVIDDWSWTCGGQNENVMVEIPIRGRYLKKVG